MIVKVNGENLEIEKSLNVTVLLTVAKAEQPVPTCHQAGVLGVIGGVVGIQKVEKY